RALITALVSQSVITWSPAYAAILSASAHRSILPRAAGPVPGDAAEHRACHQSGPARIIEVEQAADQLAGRIETADRLIVGIEDLAVGGDAQAPEGEGDAAGHRIGLVGRRVERVRPVALVDGEPFGAPAILDVGIERNVGANRLVPFCDSLDELGRIDAVELASQLFDGVADRLGHLLDAVFIALQVLHLLVENLPGELAGLLEHDAAVFRVGVVAEVRALVDEALAGRIDQDGERVGMLLELVADREVAEFRRIAFPLDRMAARPVAGGAGA